MADYFIKVSNGMPEHHKIADLSDRAFRVLVEMWCTCSRAKTDGQLKRAQFPRKTTAKVIEELQSAGLLTTHGTGASFSVEIHDYLRHQISKADMADLHEKRATAGSAGGRAKANGLAIARANSKQTPSKRSSKRVAEVEVDREEEELLTTKLTTFAALDRFEEFWETYPRRDDKGRAKTAWTRAAKSHDPQVIIDGARRYAADPNREDRYTKHPTTWLNAESWTNGPLPGPPGRAGPTGAPVSTGTQRAMAAVEAARQINEFRNQQQLQIGAAAS